ncbi:MAG: preprotein translocase subunit SecG [Clostridia bacterium]|nr:preprotein translocase subunit SecG [Clostridia bacterium]
MEYVLLAVLLLAALFIIVAVIFQKSSDEGLSGTIAGGNDSYLNKEKAPGAERVWFKWTLVISVVFAVAVLAAYIIQPDYTMDLAPDYWKNLSEFGDLFKDAATK